MLFYWFKLFLLQLQHTIHSNHIRRHKCLRIIFKICPKNIHCYPLLIILKNKCFICINKFHINSAIIKIGCSFFDNRKSNIIVIITETVFCSCIIYTCLTYLYIWNYLSIIQWNQQWLFLGIKHIYMSICATQNVYYFIVL